MTRFIFVATVLSPLPRYWKTCWPTVKHMNKEQSTGPELDAMVAERVMGWHQAFILPEYPHVGWFDAQGVLQKNIECWEPSSEIADAMEAVEKLNSDGLRVVLTQDWHGSWMATVWRKDERLCASGWHKVLAEAISRAALAEKD
jgi:hypothetical protein